MGEDSIDMVILHIGMGYLVIMHPLLALGATNADTLLPRSTGWVRRPIEDASIRCSRI